MPERPRIALVSDESATLLFERSLPPPGERCFACPHRHVPTAMSAHSVSAPVLPLPPLHGLPAPLPGPTRSVASLPSRAPSQQVQAASRQLPAPLTGPARSAANLPSQASSLPLPASSPRPAPSLPRPALLPAVDPQATLVLPDSLKPAGPEAATIERPVGAQGPATTGRDGPPRSETARPAFDELASPDITMMQQVSPVRTAPANVRRPGRRTRDARAYLVLNLWLGLLIVAGLMVLSRRDHAPPTAAEDHAKR